MRRHGLLIGDFSRSHNLVCAGIATEMYYFKAVLPK